MAKNLVIVESPAKAKTIKKFLGKDFEVKPSYGHIRDLSTKNLGIDIENNYKPTYVIEPDKKKVIEELKKAVKKSQIVWLASDEDREGEAIAWHLSEVLGLNEENARRIVFHEITKKAIQKAVENPRWINFNLVNAQQARRVLDRIVGFELSELLWKKVKNKLSAGRVQSVAVRLIVEREEEIKKFQPEKWFKLSAIFEFEDQNARTYTIKADYPEKIATQEQVKLILNELAKASFYVQKIVKKPTKRHPAPPFTTSTLQQEASRKLGFSVTKTMRIAQKLYEEGKITYMRTDSTNFSDDALEMFKNFVLENFGRKYSNPQKYKTKIKGAQEAHEAIRPTTINKVVSNNKDEQRLYELIFNRAIASQMTPAEYDRTTIFITTDDNKFNFTASSKVLKFDGFLKIYQYKDIDSSEQEEEVILPSLQENQKLSVLEIQAVNKFSNPPLRYNEASLVKKLEELGIGRPSTYAPTIDTIQKRDYVIKRNIQAKVRKIDVIVLKDKQITVEQKEEKYGAEKNKLLPTDLAIIVTDFLKKYFPSIIDYNFTANVEEDFDLIAAGKVQWTDVIDKFYKYFHPLVEKTTQNAVKEKREKLLGKDPKTNRNVYAKLAKYGPVIQLGDFGDKIPLKFASIPKHLHIDEISLEEALELLYRDPNGNLLGYDNEGIPVYTRWTKYGPVVQFGRYEKEGTKPHFVNLPKNIDINNITIEQALKLKELPKKIGEFNGKPITLGIGKYGPYLLYQDKFYSIPMKYNILTITEKEAIEVIEAHIEKFKKRIVKEFANNPEVKIVRAARGKYLQIYYKNKYYNFPTKVDIDKLSAEEAIKIAIEQENAKKNKSTNKTNKKK